MVWVLTFSTKPLWRVITAATLNALSGLSSSFLDWCHSISRGVSKHIFGLTLDFPLPFDDPELDVSAFCNPSLVSFWAISKLAMDFVAPYLVPTRLLRMVVTSYFSSFLATPVWRLHPWRHSKHSRGRSGSGFKASQYSRQVQHFGLLDSHHPVVDMAGKKLWVWLHAGLCGHIYGTRGQHLGPI